MRIYLSLAWRNIWRNKRRTLITTASVFFGVLLSSLMSSMQEGSYAQYINTIVHSWSGHIQVHQQGYWDEKVLNNSFADTALTAADLASLPGFSMAAPRLEAFALASSGDLTKGVMVAGISPSAEDKITRISRKLKQGVMLREGGKGVLLGSALARYLRLVPGDTLVLIGQGYHGVGAAGKFPVSGILKLPSGELDRSLVYMDLGKAAGLLSMPGRITSLVIMLDKEKQTEEALELLRAKAGTGLEVMDWKAMNDLLLKQIESDRQSNYITKALLYVIIAFGMLGTVMMMMAERTREIGALLALGMKKAQLLLVLLLETLALGLLGVVSGLAAAIPLTWYFVYHPIPLTGQVAEMTEQMGFEAAMFFSASPEVFLRQALTVFILVLIIGLWPLFVLRRLRIIQALHKL